ncbi:MAG: ATP-binding protein [Elusimicrobiota bacterium]
MTTILNATPPLEYLEALRPLFDCLTDGICVADAEGRLLYANAAAGRLLGPAAAETGERMICDILCGRLKGKCGETANSCPVKVPRGPQDAVTFQGTFGPSDRHLRVRCLRVRLSRAERHFLVVEDCEAEAELERRQEELRQMFAHDVRAPLTNALAVLRTLEDRGAGSVLASSDIELVRLGVRGCARISALVDAYLETSRLEEGAMPVHCEPVDVRRLIEDCVDEQREAARVRGLELSFAVPQGLSARADPELLRRAVQNLISNALKFTSGGGRVSVGAGEDAGSIVIRVADCGPGIPPEELPRIFERFYQGKGAGRRCGFGLGLTFCRAALLAMGGDVSVESQERKGSVFTLRLPKAAASPAAV